LPRRGSQQGSARTEDITAGSRAEPASRAVRSPNYHPIFSHTTTRMIETFDNPQPSRNYTIRIEIPEFTCLCPKTGQPDFAEITLEYVPDRLCLELKSLKLYIWSFRDQGAFHEAVTNRILSELSETCLPHFMRITARFNVRGGIYTTVVAEHRADGWTPAAPVPLP